MNNVLEIDSDCPDRWSFLGSSCSVDHLLRVPASVGVEIETGSGSIRLQGLEGIVLAKTGSGGIELVDVRGNVSAETGSGSIVLDGISATADVVAGSGSIRGDVTSLHLNAQTGSGSIDLLFGLAPDEVGLETGSGSITVIVPSGSYHLDLRTSSGSSRSAGISDDPSSSRTITATTGSGSIRVDGE